MRSAELSVKRLVVGLVVLFGLVCGFSTPAADFNGDGTNDIGIFRADTGMWAIRGITRVYFGGSPDEAMPGDYNGDGICDIAIYRANTGMWAVMGITRVYFGGSTDHPLVGISAGGGLWDQNGSDIYYNSGDVGIGTSSPATPLQIDGGSGAYLGGGGYLITGRTTSANIVMDTNEIQVRNNGSAEELKLNRQGGDITMVGSGGSSDLVSIGTTLPLYKLDVRQNSNSYVANFFNDGNSQGRLGIRIQSGTDNNTGTNMMINFFDGDADEVGYISSSGGTVSYNPFTASHLASVPEEKNKEGFPYGTVVCLRATRPHPKRPRQVNYEVEPSRKARDQAVFGIYAGKDEAKDNSHSIYALGDGQILVTEEGGDIEIGDYLATSNKEGHAMKQGDGILRNYTVAKAQEPVVWDKVEGDSKLIACTYHAQ